MARQHGDPDQQAPLTGKSRKALFIIALVAVILLTALISYGFAFFYQIQEPQRVLLDRVEFEAEYDVDQYFSEHVLNIALLGFDRGWNREALGEYLFRPDMLAIISIDFKNDSIAIVRIPRDSYVPIYGMDGTHAKINTSFYYGYRFGGGDNPDADGIRYTLQTVSNTLGGIPIHYYLSVDMYSIIALVDAMGGIYYEVEETIYDKHWIVGRVLVPEGPQVMDGVTYLRYLQYRDSSSSQDYGRIDRQMNLLKETYLYLREKGKITDIPATYRIYKDYVETDLSYKQIAALAFYARDFKVTDESLRFYTMRGGGQMKDGRWYEVLRQDLRVKLIKEVFGIEAEPWPQIILEDSPEYLAEQERIRLEEAAAAGEDVDGVILRNLWGITAEEAGYILEEDGFVVGEIREIHYNMEPGLLIRTEPAGGMIVQEGAVIDLIISLGLDPDS